MIVAILLAATSPSVAYAEEGQGAAQQGDGAISLATGTTPTVAAPEAKARAWSGEAEAGVITANGNSRSESLRARFKLEYEPGAWKHGLRSDFVRVSEGGETTTEQFTAAGKSERTLTPRSYLFGTARWENDRFAGYGPRISEAAGYGRRFPFSDRLKLALEAGGGGRHTWFSDGTRESEVILRLAADLTWKLGEASEFSENAFSEFGEEDVHSESSTSLKVRVNESFSLKVNVTVKHDTVVPDDRQKIDRITSLTLVYDL
jgi:putative salt-induced outer membrane protein